MSEANPRNWKNRVKSPGMPGRGETILSFASSGLPFIRIYTGGSQKALAPTKLQMAGYINLDSEIGLAHTAEPIG